MVTNTLSLAALIAGALTIWAQTTGRTSYEYLFKPLATSLLIVLALQAPVVAPASLRWGVVTALVFSLAGDVLLMLPDRFFSAGLAAFLGAHISYAITFRLNMPSWPSLYLYVPFLAYALVIYRMLHPGLGNMRWPVVIYELAIITAAWLALGRGLQLGEGGAVRAAIGSLLFLISDSTLAINRFVRPLRASSVLILGTYYLGQWLLATTAYP